MNNDLKEGSNKKLYSGRDVLVSFKGKIIGEFQSIDASVFHENASPSSKKTRSDIKNG